MKSTVAVRLFEVFVLAVVVFALFVLAVLASSCAPSYQLGAPPLAAALDAGELQAVDAAALDAGELQAVDAAALDAGELQAVDAAVLDAAPSLVCPRGFEFDRCPASGCCRRHTSSVGLGCGCLVGGVCGACEGR